MPHCDECGTPVSSSDRNFYGGGAYCEEHHPDPDGENCGECGARLAAWESPDRTVDLAMKVLGMRGADISKIRDWSTNDLGDVRTWLACTAAKAQDAVRFIDQVFDDRVDAELKNRAAAEGNRAGRAGFEAGLARAPYLDTAVRYLLKHYEPQYHERIFDNWLRGWDAANAEGLDKPSPI